MHFTKKRDRSYNKEAAIHLRDISINPTTEAKYLGVMFDRKLKFRSHVDHAIKKGTKFALAVTRIAKCTWGTPFKYIKRLYTAVVRPRTQYAAAIWHRPEDYKQSPIIAQTKGLTKVQRLAMSAISGCFRTTPTDTLLYETQLPPVEMELRKQVKKYLTHIQTLPKKDPVANCMRRAKLFRENSQTRTNMSNLEHLIVKYPELVSENMETILTYVRPPWWNPNNITINIKQENKEQAKWEHEVSLREHTKSPGTTCIYTDGSGIEGNIAAATYSTTTNDKIHQYLGEEQTTNVYTAELTGIQLAMISTLEHSPPTYRNASSLSTIKQP